MTTSATASRSSMNATECGYDNSGIDGSEQAVAPHARRRPRVMLPHPRNSGICAAPMGPPAADDEKFRARRVGVAPLAISSAVRCIARLDAEGKCDRDRRDVGDDRRNHDPTRWDPLERLAARDRERTSRDCGGRRFLYNYRPGLRQGKPATLARAKDEVPRVLPR